uniref:Transmembrane protein 238 n=1 Tax=Oncorhynchus kisutch TaxID=8019 RepID=A0A8C7GPD4_ONCKI
KVKICRSTHLPLFSGCIDTMMDLRRIGGCVPLFFLAIGFDVIGFIILFIGIFANLRIDGMFYGDFLIYSGSIIIFISLAWWIMWYVGNIQVSEDSFGTSLMKNKRSFVQLARKLSERLSKKSLLQVTHIRARVNKLGPGATQVHVLVFALALHS